MGSSSPTPRGAEALRTTGGAWVPIAARRLPGSLLRGGSVVRSGRRAGALRGTCDDSSNDWRERSERWQT